MAILLFPSKPTGETMQVTFPFLGLLDFGETITGATTAATVFSGTDANPGAILPSLPTTSSTNVTQVVSAGVAGVIYEVTCTVTTSKSNVLVLSGLVAVITAGGKFGS